MLRCHTVRLSTFSELLRFATHSKGNYSEFCVRFEGFRRKGLGREKGLGVCGVFKLEWKPTSPAVTAGAKVEDGRAFDTRTATPRAAVPTEAHGSRPA